MTRAAHDVDMWRSAVGIVVLLNQGSAGDADLLAQQVIADGDAHALIAAMGYLILGLAEDASRLTGAALEQHLLSQAAGLREPG